MYDVCIKFNVVFSFIVTKFLFSYFFLDEKVSKKSRLQRINFKTTHLKSRAI